MFVMHDPLIHDLGFSLRSRAGSPDRGIFNDHPNRKTGNATRS
ncbi:hypothetical protein MNJPNG_17510 [Cupriavidus oxalaticus]